MVVVCVLFFILLSVVTCCMEITVFDRSHDTCVNGSCYMSIYMSLIRVYFKNLYIIDCSSRYVVKCHRLLPGNHSIWQVSRYIYEWVMSHMNHNHTHMHESCLTCERTLVGWVSRYSVFKRVCSVMQCVAVCEFVACLFITWWLETSVFVMSRHTHITHWNTL